MTTSTDDDRPARPRSITGAGWLFVAVGAAGLGRVLLSLWSDGGLRLPPDWAWPTATAGVALAGGVLLLRGCGWARWLLVAWLAFHVWLSLHHEPLELAVHAALFLGITWLLFRPATRAWLRASGGRR